MCHCVFELKNLIAAFTFILTVVSCSQVDTVQLCNSANSNCVTFITQDSIRYIIPGSTTKIPNTNYAILQVGHLDPLADAIYMCWLESEGWQITIPKAKIVKNLLDSGDYRIFTELPTDNRGIPTAIDFSQDPCAIFDYELMRLMHDNGITQATLK